MQKMACTWFFLILLTGCSFLQPVQQPKVNNYELNAKADAIKLQAQPNRYVLLVNNTLPSPGFETNKMMYSQQPYQLDFFAKHKWLVSPAQMFNRSLVQSLQQSGYFKAIATVPYTGQYDLRLDTRMLEVKQNVGQSSSEIVFNVYAQLIDAHSMNIMTSRQFQAKVKTAPNPQAAVQAANQAQSQILSQILHFVSTHSQRK